MNITAVIDRIENDKAILITDEIGVEITIPLYMIEGNVTAGEKLSLTIDDDVV